MKVRVTFILEEETLQRFKKFCVAENDNQAKSGMYSEQLTKAITLLIDSKKPKDESIDIEGLDDNTDESPVQDFL